MIYTYSCISQPTEEYHTEIKIERDISISKTTRSNRSSKQQASYNSTEHTFLRTQARNPIAIGGQDVRGGIEGVKGGSGAMVVAATPLVVAPGTCKHNACVRECIKTSNVQWVQKQEGWRTG